MTVWLDPVRRALDARTQPNTFFFRDDDAGWNDARLMTLLEVFAEHDLPIDLAAIPLAVSPELARNINARMSAAPHRVRVHQHGYAHLNHEASGRKCEFGPARDILLQKADIQDGKKRLQDLFTEGLDPIFTPPWNRCTQATCQCLIELDFQILSRESGAARLDVGRPHELPIHIDWFAHRKGVRLSRDRFGELLANAITTLPLVGVMFHHAIMDDGEMSDAAALLRLLSSRGRARSCLMSHALGAHVLSPGDNDAPALMHRFNLTDG